MSVRVPLALLVLSLGAALPTNSLGQMSGRCPAASEATARQLQAQVQVLHQAARWKDAIQPARCLVSVEAELFGATHPSTQNARQDLASILRKAGRPAEAAAVEVDGEVPLAGEAPKQDQSEVEHLLIESKSLLDRGDVAGARRSVSEAKRLAVSRHLDRTLVYAAALNEDGRVFEREGDVKKAAGLYVDSDKLAKVFGESGREARAVALNNLGLLQYRRGELPQAKATLERAAALERTDDPEAVPTRVNLGQVCEALGEHERAREIFLAARDQIVRAYGGAHPNLIAIYIQLTAQSWRAGALADAVVWQLKVNEVAERNVRNVLTLGSERQKLSYMVDLTPPADASVDLCMESPRGDQRAGRMAFEAVIQRKGRVLAAYASSLERVRQWSSPTQVKLRARFVDYQKRRSARLLAGAVESASDASAADAEIEGLLAQIGGADAAFDDLARTVTLEQIRGALPVGSVLVELVAYRPQHDVPDRSLRYAVFALSSAHGLSWAPLGEEGPIVRRVRDLRAALKNPASSNVKALARDVYKLVFGPVEGHLAGADRLFVSPDGIFNLLPFGALVDDGGRYLVERLSVDHLTSGRSLVRHGPGPRADAPAVVVADPDYGLCGRTKSAACGVEVAATVREERGAGRLCATRAEGAAIAQLFPGARLLVDATATETEIKSARRPQILHLATHGFFGLDLVRRIVSCGGNPPGDARRAESNEPVDGLLRSGLVLAGANRGQSGADDGFLTAAEVSGMDLGGTQLVVLSACETGLGQASRGEGVFGLRRAFELAGAASQVMSLWNVESASAAELMVAFYRGWSQRMPRKLGTADALAAAQRGMLKGGKSDWAHPYYWASFIASGEWRAVADVGRVGR